MQIFALTNFKSIEAAVHSIDFDKYLSDFEVHMLKMLEQNVLL